MKQQLKIFKEPFKPSKLTVF